MNMERGETSRFSPFLLLIRDMNMKIVISIDGKVNVNKKRILVLIFTNKDILKLVKTEKFDYLCTEK